MTAIEPRRPAVGLVRVSTDTQALGSDSPRVQEDRIRQWAQWADYEIVQVYGQHDEGASGYIPVMDRDDARAAIEHAIRVKGPLVCYSLSRLGRNAVDLLATGKHLLDNGSNLIGISDGLNLAVLMESAIGKFMFGVQALAAQLFRDEIAEKTQNALQSRRENGCRAGRVPYGYRVDPDRPEKRIKNKVEETYYPHLIENPAEQEVLSIIRSLRACGPAQIVESLARSGMTNRNGKPWDPSSIRRMIAKMDR